MSTIQPGGMLPPMMPTDPNQAAGATGAPNTVGAPVVISAAGPAEVRQSTANPLKDANGAPLLASPISNLSADDLIELLQSIRSKSQDKQMETARVGLEGSKIQAETNRKLQGEKIQAAAKKQAQQNKSSLAQKIFGWIGKIFAAVAAAVAMVVAAVATPFSGGAAAALVALAAVGLVAACMSIADQISKECGGPEISLSNMMNKMVGGMLKGFGVPEEKATQIAKAVSGTLAIVMPAALLVEPKLMGNVVQGIAQLSGANEALVDKLTMGFTMAATLGIAIGTAVVSIGAMAKLPADLANTAMKLAGNILQAASKGVEGLSSVGSGVAGIIRGVAERDLGHLNADRKALDAMLAKINQQMEDQREDLRKLIQQIEEGAQAVSQMMQSSADSMSQITSNLGKRAAV